MNAHKYYPVLHVQDNTPQFTLRWQDHQNTLPPPEPPDPYDGHWPCNAPRPHPASCFPLIAITWLLLTALIISAFHLFQT